VCAQNDHVHELLVTEHFSDAPVAQVRKEVLEPVVDSVSGAPAARRVRYTYRAAGTAYKMIAVTLVYRVRHAAAAAAAGAGHDDDDDDKYCCVARCTSVDGWKPERREEDDD
jgi:hypothetical protein